MRVTNHDISNLFTLHNHHLTDKPTSVWHFEFSVEDDEDEPEVTVTIEDSFLMFGFTLTAEERFQLSDKLKEEVAELYENGFMENELETVLVLFKDAENPSVLNYILPYNDEDTECSVLKSFEVHYN